MKLKKRLEVIDVQNRRILYTPSDIALRTANCGFSRDTPQHFETLFTQPDTIYKHKVNHVHVYHKRISGMMHTVTTVPVKKGRMEYYTINSWFTETDDTEHTLEVMMGGEYDENIKKDLDDKIADSKSWMEVLYEDLSYLEDEGFQHKLAKKGLDVNVEQAPDGEEPS